MSGLIDVAERAGIPVAEAQSVFDAILEKLNQGDRVFIRGFGTFTRKTQKERVVSSTVLKKPVTVPERFTIHFKPSDIARNNLNEGNKSNG